MEQPPAPANLTFGELFDYTFDAHGNIRPGREPSTSTSTNLVSANTYQQAPRVIAGASHNNIPPTLGLGHHQHPNPSQVPVVGQRLTTYNNNSTCHPPPPLTVHAHPFYPRTHPSSLPSHQGEHMYTNKQHQYNNLNAPLVQQRHTPTPIPNFKHPNLEQFEPSKSTQYYQESDIESNLQSAVKDLGINRLVRGKSDRNNKLL